MRTQALRTGEPLSTVTGRLTRAAGLETRLLPATDGSVAHGPSTRAPAAFPFQEWFVARGHRDEVDEVSFDGALSAQPAPGVLERAGQAPTPW